MSKKYLAEVWMKHWGDLVLVEWNLCNCCPSTVTMTWGKRWNDAGYYGYRNKSAWTKLLKSKGWVRL